MVHMVALAMTLTLIHTVWHARHGIRNNLVQDIAPRRARSLFADAWPFLVIIFLFAFFIIVTLLDLAGVTVSYLAALGTLCTVIFLPPIDAMIERAAYTHAKEGQGGQIQTVILRALRIVLIVGAVVFVAGAWGVDFHAIAADSIGGRFASALVDIGLVALMAYVLWEVSRHHDRPPDRAGGRRRAGGDGG